MSKDHKSRHANSNDNDNVIINNMINHNCVKFVIWHTLRRLPEEEEATRTVRLQTDNGQSDDNTCVMTHDWKIHLDIVEGDPRPIIARIEADFGPTFLRRRSYVSNRPRKKLYKHKQAWRCFESRQKCAGTPPVQFRIVGMGGTILRVKSDPSLEPVEGYFFEKNISTFGTPATNELPNVIPIPLPPGRAFSLEQVVSIPTMNTGCVKSENEMIQSPPPTSVSWEKGEEGIENIRQSLLVDQHANADDSKLVNTIISVQLCEDTPSKNDLENITKMCQNFVKYEDAIDRIVQNSRDSIPLGIPMPPKEGFLVHSNKSDIEGDTNRARHDSLEACSSSIDDLVQAMNPRENQTYKLVLAATEEQTWKARFFFCMVPDDVDFTMGLLRFCTLFVHNSFRFQKPKPLKASRSIEDQIEFLFAMVIRDRFVEEMLLLQGGNSDMSLCSSFQLDMDSMQDEDASFPLSLVHARAEEDNFSGFSDVRFPDRKRPRPMSPPISNAQDEASANSSQSSNVDVVLRSHLCIENKYYTAAKLATMGKKLSTGTSNSKTERLLRLKAYFDARDDELNKYFENDDHDSGILGIEFVFQNDQNRDDNNICIILKGGRQMTIPRRSVCESKYGEKEFPIQILDMSEERAKAIFENLYPKETIVKNFDGYISRIDNYIDDLQQKGAESNSCRFALIHDLFCECKNETQR